MSNAFDSENHPGKMPEELVVGDRWRWKRDDLAADYPPASYTLKYSLRLQDTATEIEITSTVADFVVEVAASTTVNYTAGVYQWQLYIVRNSDSERITLGRGTVKVLTNSDAAASDPRSHTKKVLDAVEAVLEDRATKDQESYSIQGRTLSRTPITDLLALRDHYRREYNREKNAERLKRGLSSRQTIRVRMP